MAEKKFMSFEELEQAFESMSEDEQLGFLLFTVGQLLYMSSQRVIGKESANTYSEKSRISKKEYRELKNFMVNTVLSVAASHYHEVLVALPSEEKETLMDQYLKWKDEQEKDIFIDDAEKLLYMRARKVMDRARKNII